MDSVRTVIVVEKKIATKSEILAPAQCDRRVLVLNLCCTSQTLYQSLKQKQALTSGKGCRKMKKLESQVTLIFNSIML